MKHPVLLALKLYKIAISPFLPSSCRFVPSCSTYAYESITRHGLIKGGWASLCRLSRCHPFHCGGYDPCK